MPDPSPRNGSSERLSRLAAHLATIASHIQASRPETQLVELLGQAQRLCEAAAAQPRATSVKTLLANLTMALQTWQHMWPRLGAQSEFRLAVAREARLWSQRFASTRMREEMLGE